ncbi:hypothetical protein TanjilG_05527 [Lupinus angustifolius]|uniref:Uncharacterized protein n=1 Tax=Lupinus angustifolius TaxID=3871 RepID=A0A1J7IC16_LUPAN|nr:PREDICTED: uncharacterized protein LOC109349397 [Lupinus angustifolius]OIW10379.1 hypothetical protein TanjilG_05527 [Lupinus angustifolius]
MNNNFSVKKESPTFPNHSSNLTLSTMQEKIEMQRIMERESKMTATPEWTDEKHSMYLKSIEASFVNQMYDSKHTLASNNPANTSAQFKVLRGGCWKTINFERENPQLSRTNPRHKNLTANPWIQHYRSSSKQPNVAAPSLLESITSTSAVFVDLEHQRNGFPSSSSGQLHLCETHVSHDDMLYSDTEMSDQNFADEDVEDKEENIRSNVKRLKETFDN